MCCSPQQGVDNSAGNLVFAHTHRRELTPAERVIRRVMCAGPAPGSSAAMRAASAIVSFQHSTWARAYYDLQRERGKSHHAAVRALAFK